MAMSEKTTVSEKTVKKGPFLIMASHFYYYIEPYFYPKSNFPDCTTFFADSCFNFEDDLDL